MFTRDHVFGFVVGVGVAAVGFFFYKKHQQEVDEFLAGKGIHLPGSEAGGSDSLEELVARKERIEDLIAEREAEHV